MLIVPLIFFAGHYLYMPVLVVQFTIDCRDNSSPNCTDSKENITVRASAFFDQPVGCALEHTVVTLVWSECPVCASSSVSSVSSSSSGQRVRGARSGVVHEPGHDAAVLPTLPDRNRARLLLREETVHTPTIASHHFVLQSSRVESAVLLNFFFCLHRIDKAVMTNNARFMGLSTLLRFLFMIIFVVVGAGLGFFGFRRYHFAFFLTFFSLVGG